MECKNCNKSVGATNTFCPHCGQKMGLGRLNFKQLLRDLWIAFSNTDQGILLLTKQLVYRPGKVARDYISGKRKTYYNPFSYLVLMVAIALYFILQFETSALNYPGIGPENIELMHFAFKYFNVFILIMCPIYGFLIWLLFLGRQTNFVENLALAAYLSGQTMLYYILALGLFSIFPSYFEVLGIIIGLLINIWFVAAVLQFYRTRSVWSVFKTVLVLAITQVLSQGLVLTAFSIYKKLII